MNMFRNGTIAVLFLLLSGCMMMDMHKPHGAPMESTSTGHTTETKNAPQPATNQGGEKKEAAAAASHSSTPSGMAIVGGVLMVVMMLAMML